MDIAKMTIKAIHTGLENKDFKAEEVTRAYLARIKAYDQGIGAFLSLDEAGAIAMSRGIDEKIQGGEAPGLLTGVPLAVKDNLCTRGLKTTCASRMLEDFVPPYDATVVGRLRERGAVILGKANMDEFAMGSSNENSAFYPVKNPWDMTRVSGGSSGGPAAAVAAGFAPYALGSDTGGSIRMPASFCGLVGVKPTYGAVSRYGLIAFGSSLDQVGPFARTVEDAAIALEGIEGFDPKDATSVEGRVRGGYTASMLSGVKGMRIGVPREFFAQGVDLEVKKTVLRAVKRLQALGAEVEEFSLPITESGLSAYYMISSAEASSNLGRYDGVRFGYRTPDYDGFEEMVVKSRTEAFGQEVKRRIMLGTYVLSSGYYDAYYKKAMLFRQKVRRLFKEAFEVYDAVVSPTVPVLPFKLGEKTQDPLAMYLADLFTVNVNIAGIPAISLPAGFSEGGLPVGIQFMGDHFEVTKLFRIAYALEQDLGLNLVPELKEVE
jgi:aspartyl-tRNA(Asn)/glutamyl-tRNA(Gln) amidotransferase subunit A